MEKRYQRLKDLKKFGYNVEWEILFSKKVAIVGIGGLGSVSAEMLVRCGVGEIYIFDKDQVNEENLNRLTYKPIHMNKSKVEVLKEILFEINPGVKVFTFNRDILDIEFEHTFEENIQKVDLVLQGLDNLPARQYLNIKCVKFCKPFIDAGANRSGLGGYIQPIIPKQTACYACLGSIDLIQKKKEQGEPCTASLPSTMAILAGIQVQEALKYFLNLGQMASYLLYDGISNNIQEIKLNRDPNCSICGENRNSTKFPEEICSEEELKYEIQKLGEN